MDWLRLVSSSALAIRSPFWKPETVIGGRVWTDRRFEPPIDLGASWLHGGRGNPLKAVAANLGLRTRVSEYGNLAAYELGTVGRSAVSRAAFESEYTKLEAAVYRQSGWTYVSTLARRWLGRPGTRVSVADVLSALPAPLNRGGSFGALSDREGNRETSTPRLRTTSVLPVYCTNR